MNKFNEIQRIELTIVQKSFINWIDKSELDAVSQYLQFCFESIVFESESYCFGSAEQSAAKLFYKLIKIIKDIEAADNPHEVKDLILRIFKEYTTSIETYRLFREIFGNGVFIRKQPLIEDERYCFYVFFELLGFIEEMTIDNMDMAKVKTKAA